MQLKCNVKYIFLIFQDNSVKSLTCTVPFAVSVKEATPLTEKKRKEKEKLLGNTFSFLQKHEINEVGEDLQDYPVQPFDQIAPHPLNCATKYHTYLVVVTPPLSWGACIIDLFKLIHSLNVKIYWISLSSCISNYKETKNYKKQTRNWSVSYKTFRTKSNLHILHTLSF